MTIEQSETKKIKKEIFEEALLEALKEHLSISVDQRSSSDSYGRRSYTTEIEIFFKGVPICITSLYT